MRIFRRAIVPILMLSLIVGAFLVDASRRRVRVTVEDESYYLLVAQHLDHHYKKIGVNTSALVIHEVVREAAKSLKDERGLPFDLVDIIAIASMESSFCEKSTGKHGEKGIFQVLDSSSALEAIGCEGMNPYDPRVNTRMGIHVLCGKYDKYRNRKLAIIAYNGIVPTSTGWNDKYWRKFLLERGIVSVVVKRAEKERTPSGDLTFH
jgi:hypothetical protein